MRSIKTYTILKSENIKSKLLIWSQQFKEVVWLDTNDYNDTYGEYDAILAVDSQINLKPEKGNNFENLKKFRNTTNDWIFGYLTYDLKNELETLTSNNRDSLGFPDICFFQPKRIFLLKGETLTLLYLMDYTNQMEIDLNNIKSSKIDFLPIRTTSRVNIQMRIFKDQYFTQVTKMLAHIERGDIYEANFCQEFYSENTLIDPLSVYSRLNEMSKTPFSSFLKIGRQYLLCASPERYLKKDKKRIISQPIKGTAPRSEDLQKDHELRIKLQTDPKELSENIMIVDMVRNDLSHTAIKGSVQVLEMCKVYPFNQVHQMISTVSSEVNESTDPVDIISSTFPMGSMTGAPKVSAMKIIEKLEGSKRGLYSGAVGYFKPDGDFDFNVVIRSILYNEKKNYVSYSVGSAITALSDPAKEYEECLVKAKAMKQVLEEG